QISSSRLPCGCVMYSYARIIVRRSARAAGAIVMASSALKGIMILILIRGPRSIRFSFGWRGGLSLPVGVGLPLLARRAEPVQLELVVRDGEAVLLGHPVLKLLDSLVLELGDVAAGGADQVVVVVALVGGGGDLLWNGAFHFEIDSQSRKSLPGGPRAVKRGARRGRFSGASRAAGPAPAMHRDPARRRARRGAPAPCAPAGGPQARR